MKNLKYVFKNSFVIIYIFIKIFNKFLIYIIFLILIKYAYKLTKKNF